MSINAIRPLFAKAHGPDNVSLFSHALSENR
jgi:hypothetical protein